MFIDNEPTRFWLPPSIDMDLRAGESGVLGERVLEGDKGGCTVGHGEDKAGGTVVRSAEELHRLLPKTNRAEQENYSGLILSSGPCKATRAHAQGYASQGLVQQPPTSQVPFG